MMKILQILHRSRSASSSILVSISPVMQRIGTSGNYPFVVAVAVSISGGGNGLRLGVEKVVEKPVSVGLELAPSYFYNCPFMVVMMMIKRSNEARSCNSICCNASHKQETQNKCNLT